MSQPRTAVFTIAARNYLPQARALMESVAQVQPEWQRRVLVVDRPVPFEASDRALFTTVDAESLAMPERRKFFFRYELLELCTAVKPWFFRALFAEGFERCVYLDPDILAYRPLAEVEALLESGALAVLVPHLTGRLNDGARPDERNILQSGAYNLGFLALARHPQLEPLLEFWCQKSEREFGVELGNGLFTDQRWMDLVPGMFDGVKVLRHEGYDVAYWNLPHRTLAPREGGHSVNGVPLVFFHFSGLDPRNPQEFSKHQNRYRLDTVGPARALVESYCAALERHGLAQARAGWGYGATADGVPLPATLRAFYRHHPEVEAWAGEDPFALTSQRWNEPLDAGWPLLTRPMQALYESRAHLRLRWPNVAGADREGYARWFSESGATLVDTAWVAPVKASLSEGPPEHLREAPRRAPELSQLTGAARKAIVALREGRLPISPLRWRQLYRQHLDETAADRAAIDSSELPLTNWSGPLPLGLSIAGYFSEGTGVAAGAQGSVAACRAVGLEHELVDARPRGPVPRAFSHALLHVNADQTLIAARALGSEFFRDRHSIGVWAWELEELPDAFLPAFAPLDEIWAPSQFIQRAVAEKSPHPVVWMPHAVTVEPAALSRAHFELPESAFVVLTMYDALSYEQRKNPRGAIEAFQRAFAGRSDVRLVVRVNHAASRPEELARLKEVLAKVPGARLFDRPMLRAEAQALIAASDALVSLHRAEGFGLNIAEAMLLGKPVVVTGWSGNLDFTHPQTAFLVDHQMVELAEAVGPYPRGQRWAEPDLDHAAGQLLRMVDDGALRAKVARAGQALVRLQHGPDAVGRRYLKRLALTP